MTTTEARRPRISDEQLRATRSHISRMLDVNVDVGVLDAGDTEKLVELTLKLYDDSEDGLGKGYNFGRLSKRERKRWEQLVERAAGRPIFEEARFAGKLAAKAREAAAAAVRQPPRPHLRASGDAWLPRELMVEFFAVDRQAGTSRLGLDDIGVLVLLLWALENSGNGGEELLLRTCRFVDGGEILEFDANRGLFAAHVDPEDRVDWRACLVRLVECGFFEISGAGKDRQLRRGRVAKVLCERRLS